MCKFKVEPCSGALKVCMHFISKCFTNSPLQPFWQQRVVMPLFGQDSTHSELILAHLILALLPAVCPTELNCLVLLSRTGKGLAGTGVGSRFTLMWSAYVHMAALVEYT